MVLNVAAYLFVAIDDPAAVAARVRALAEGHDLRGSVLVAPEGINVFLAGAADAVDAALAALRQDPRFAALAAKRSWSARSPFARLKVKVKREIIAFGRAARPGTARAPAVAPDTLARWLRRGRDDDDRAVVLLDTRNREEVAHGTFAGALTLPIDRFREFPAAIEAERDTLAGATVVSFCTGGIRCEKAALWMTENGFDRVWQLDGGILGYFDAVGSEHYAGHCFVFDERVALDPALAPRVDGAPAASNG
jgi:UPF0176 protein